jgi:hypothetical protein
MNNRNNRNERAVMNLQGMTQDEIKKHCPVAYQTKASNAVSENYTFIPTSDIINDMDKLGWKVGQATSVRSRKNAGYQKHLIKFFNPTIEINGKQKQKTKTSEYGGEKIPKVGSLWNFSELPNISTTDNIFNLSISLLRNYTKM